MLDKALQSFLLSMVTAALPQARTPAVEPLPPRALARIGDHRFYHGPGITCAVLSPDGKRVASAASDTAIVLWDVATGERLRELHVSQGSISRLAFSPNGERLAAASWIPFDKVGVGVFEVETGKLLRQLGDFKSEVVHLQFSADGKQLRVSESYGPISAWDAVTGKQLQLWKSPMPPPKDFEFTRCAARGVLSPNGRVIVWEICCFVGGLAPWVPDGLHVRDAKTDQLLYQKKFEPTDGRFLEPIWFCADSKHFATGYDGKVIVWETATGKEVTSLEIPNLNRFALAPDGRYVVIDEQSFRLRLWNIERGKSSRDLLLGFFDRHTTSVGPPPVFSADGTTLLVATASTLRFFDGTTGKERRVSGHRAPVTPRFSAEGRTLLTSCKEMKCRWKVSGKEPMLLRLEARPLGEDESLARSDDDRLFLDLSSKNQVRVRETATGRVLHTLPEYARIATFSPDAARLLFYSVEGGGSFGFRLYDVKTGARSGVIEGVIQRGGPVFSPNSRLVALVENSGVVHLHDAVTGKSVRNLQPSRPLPDADKSRSLFDPLFSPDGTQLIVTSSLWGDAASESKGPVQLPTRVFDIASGREIAQFYANPEKTSQGAELMSMACSPDGRLLAVAEKNSGMVRILEIGSGKVRAELTGHRHGVHGLAFAPDGKTLASGGEDNVVFLWDVTGDRTSVAKPPRDSNLPSLWKDLTSEDGQCAGLAIASFLRKPDVSTAFLQERLRPAEALDNKRLVRLIADLDGDAFEVREAASRELTRLGERVEADLRRELTNRPSLEMRRRIEVLLEKADSHALPPQTLQALRAIEILEHIDTPAARRCLQKMAQGATDARPTQDAKASLKRRANRR